MREPGAIPSLEAQGLLLTRGEERGAVWEGPAAGAEGRHCAETSGRAERGAPLGCMQAVRGPGRCLWGACRWLEDQVVALGCMQAVRGPGRLLWGYMQVVQPLLLLRVAAREAFLWGRSSVSSWGVF